MRKAMRRSETNATYWDRRWAEAGSDAASFTDLSIYPIRFAEMVMHNPGERALELGCGPGRVVKHYHGLGWQITGIERSQVAVTSILDHDAALDVRVGDATDLELGDGEITVLMAFGLYHNLEHDLEEALAESARVLAAGGRFCISMRPDNIEMRLNERYWRWRNRHRDAVPHFHKWLVDAPGFAAMLERHGLHTQQLQYARNMSNLYRVPFLRERCGADAQEQERRAGGYRLNTAGRAIDGLLMRRWPAQFCNALVFIGTKEGSPR